MLRDAVDRPGQVLRVGGDVEAGGVQVAVPQEGGDGFEAKAVIDQVFGEGVAQEMRGEVGNSRKVGNALEDHVDAASAERARGIVCVGAIHRKPAVGQIGLGTDG